MIFVVILFSIPISTHAQENSNDNVTEKEKKSAIKALNEKYLLKKTVTAGEPFDWDFTSIEILNIGNETAIIKDIKKSQFFVKDESYKLSDTSIDRDSVDVISTLPVSLKPGESVQFDVTSNEKSKMAGVYSGKLIVLGNFDALDVDLDVVIKQDPEELMGYSVIGIFVAGILSFLLKFGVNYWNNSPSIQNKKKRKSIGQCIFVSASQLTMAETRKSNLEVNVRLFDPNTHECIKEETKKSDDELKNKPGKILLQIGYSIAVALVAIPVTLFAQGSLTGDPVLDSGIAVGIGASLYGTKDLVGELKKS